MSKLDQLIGGGAGIGVIGAVALVALSSSVWKRSQIAALVVEQWTATAQPTDERETYVSVVGRFQGFWAWLRSLLGDKSGSGKMMVDGRNVIIVDASGWHVIPLTSVSSLHHGYYRPLWAAIMIGFIVGMIVAAFGMVGGGGGDGMGALMGGMLLGVLVGIAYYFLNRTLVISVTEMAGASWGFAFKGSRLDPQGAASIVAIVQQLVNVRRYG